MVLWGIARSIFTNAPNNKKFIILSPHTYFVLMLYPQLNNLIPLKILSRAEQLQVYRSPKINKCQGCRVFGFGSIILNIHV